MNRSARESGMNRPNCDLPTGAAAVAVVPGLVLDGLSPGQPAD